jgi:hypothetical protein
MMDGILFDNGELGRLSVNGKTVLKLASDKCF